MSKNVQVTSEQAELMKAAALTGLTIIGWVDDEHVWCVDDKTHKEFLWAPRVSSNNAFMLTNKLGLQHSHDDNIFTCTSKDGAHTKRATYTAETRDAVVRKTIVAIAATIYTKETQNV